MDPKGTHKTKVINEIAKIAKPVAILYNVFYKLLMRLIYLSYR